jgi:hypothetical protein
MVLGDRSSLLGGGLNGGSKTAVTTNGTERTEICPENGKSWMNENRVFKRIG